MLAYKLKETRSDVYLKGRIFVFVNNEAVCLATPVLPTDFCGNWFFNKLKNEGAFEEVLLQNEKWVHPHLVKKVREVFAKEQN